MLCTTTKSDENNSKAAPGRVPSYRDTAAQPPQAPAEKTPGRNRNTPRSFPPIPSVFGDTGIFRFAQKLIKIISKSTLSDTEHSCYLWAVFSVDLCHSTADQTAADCKPAVNPAFSGQV